jgi:hypothetical protein
MSETAAAGTRPAWRSRPQAGAEAARRAASGELAPWVATSCRIAMGVTMAFMLVIMI